MRHGDRDSEHSPRASRRVRISDWFSGGGPLAPDNVVSKLSIPQTS
jgi:hypothetical protein